MASTRSPLYAHDVTPTAERFVRIFDREPTARELSVFAATHEALVLRLPGRVRRRTARVIARL
jgi:hypothetical protein